MVQQPILLVIAKVSHGCLEQGKLRSVGEWFASPSFAVAKNGSAGVLSARWNTDHLAVV